MCKSIKINMKLVKIVSIYKILGEAKTDKLSEEDIIKILKNRKILKHYVDEFELFLVTCQDSLKPDSFDIIQDKINNWDNITDEEKIDVKKVLSEYQEKLNKAILEEQEKDYNITLEKLPTESIISLAKDSNLEFNKIEELLEFND